MGYRIDYQPIKKVRGAQKQRSSTMAFTGLFFFLFLLLTHLFWPEGKAMLQRLLIPGDPAVTVAALEGFCNNLRSDATFIDAFTVFFQQVLSGG